MNMAVPCTRMCMCHSASTAMHLHAGEELFSARMAYEAWVAPSLEAAGCVAPRFCGVGTDRSPLIIDAARDVP